MRSVTASKEAVRFSAGRRDNRSSTGRHARDANRANQAAVIEEIGLYYVRDTGTNRELEPPLAGFLFAERNGNLQRRQSGSDRNQV